VSIVATEKQYYMFLVCVCNFSYPSCKSHAPCYIDICGLSGCIMFWHFISFDGRGFIEHELYVLILCTAFI